MKPDKLNDRCAHLLSLGQFVALNAPKLTDLQAAFNDAELPNEFISNYLEYLNGMLNVKADMKMTEFQVDDCAATLYRECAIHGVTIAEFHEFISRVKAGRYGEFYGAIDVMRICSDFQEFIRDLQVARKFVREQTERAARKQIEERSIREHQARIERGEVYKPDISAILGEEPTQSKPQNNIISSALRRQGILK